MNKLILVASVALFSSSAFSWGTMSNGSGTAQSEAGTKSESGTWGRGVAFSYGGAQNVTASRSAASTCRYGCGGSGVATSGTSTNGKTWGASYNGNSSQMQQGFGSAKSGFNFRTYR